MSGAVFMRPFRSHTAHWIKQNAETRSGTPITIADDAEMSNLPLKPNTTYLYRSVLFLNSSTPTNMVWRPACTQNLDFACIFMHRRITQVASDQWGTTSAGDTQTHVMDTAAFNAGTAFHFGQSGAQRAHGMIRTGSSGGVFSIKWGGTNVTSTLEDGSFVYLNEIPDSAIVIKQNDESRNTTTTMTDDGELTFPLNSGTTYFIDTGLIFDSGATPDIKFSFNYTGTITSVGLSEGTADAKLPGAGGTGDGFSRAYHLGAGTNLTTPTVRTRQGSATASTIGGGHLRGVLVTNTSGNLKIQWAQNVSDAGNTTVHKGSYICVASDTSLADIFGTLTYKTSDTSRTNNTVTADPDIQFPTKANKKYIAECLTVLDANSATPDMQISLHDAQVNLTAGHIMRIQIQGTGTFGNTTDAGLTGQWSTSGFITAPTISAPGTSSTANKNSFECLWAQQQGGSDGTLSFDWAQNTTNATPTILRAGSWILNEEIVQ